MKWSRRLLAWPRSRCSLVFWDLTARRAAGVRAAAGWARWCATCARRRGRSALVPVLAYLSAWWAWFGSETGDRPARGRRRDRHRTGRGRSCPTRCASLWYYSGKVLAFHAGLTTADRGRAPVGVQAVDVADGPAADALPLRRRATRSPAAARTSCVSAVMLIGTPALWWPAMPVLACAPVAGRDPGRLALRRGARRLRRGHPAVVPQHRPPDVLLLHGAGGAVPGAGHGAGDGRDARPARGARGSAGRPGCWWSGRWVALVVANFVWLWPILIGIPITPEHWEAQLWLPSWRA